MRITAIYYPQKEGESIEYFTFEHFVDPVCMIIAPLMVLEEVFCTLGLDYINETPRDFGGNDFLLLENAGLYMAGRKMCEWFYCGNLT